MKAIVDQDACISCGMCIDVCDGVFSYNSEGKSVAIDSDIPEDLLGSAQEAKDVCPVEAISILDAETVMEPAEAISGNVSDNISDSVSDYNSESINLQESEETPEADGYIGSLDNNNLTDDSPLGNSSSI